MQDYYSQLDKIDEQIFKLFIEYRNKRDQLVEDFHTSVNMLLTHHRDVVDMEMDRRFKEEQK